jgi:predicted DNA-binding ribbon-helix-helix protein
MEYVQRMIPLEGGKRAAVKLDEATWTGIETISELRGTTWQKWCAPIIEATPEGENTTAMIRAAAMEALTHAVLFGEDRAHDLALMESHPLMSASGVVDDQQLNEMLSTAHVLGDSDFGGFAVMFGYSQDNQACVWVKNAMRDQPHFIFAIPEEQTNKWIMES